MCSITAELLKAGGDCIAEWLTVIINSVWVDERLPVDWKRGIILPFWKNKGDKLICGNHRGITLLSIPGKVFTRVLLTRALSAIRSRRRPQQAGFLPNRSTTDHISALRLIIEKTREFRNKRQLYIAFIDLKAAFDSIDHQSLWNILQKIGVPGKHLSLFKELYAGAESCVRINRAHSDWFNIRSGVRQGCIAAPDLFNSVVDYLMEKVCEQIPGVAFGDYDLADLEYADDTAILSGTFAEITHALEVFDTEARKLGLQINWDKTKLMMIGDGPIPEPPVFDGHVVEFVDSFIYLGSSLTRTGELRTEIDRRRGIAGDAMAKLNRPVWKQRNISRETKLKIYNALISSILLYGAETWPLNATLASRLDGFDSRSLRRIEGIHWTDHVSNEELRRRTRQPLASSIAAQKRVRWLGHVLRLPPYHPTRAIMEFNPRQAGWTRPRGAPRTRWLDVAAKDLRQCGVALENAEALAQDRSRWRSLVKTVGSTRPAHEDE